MNTQEDLSRRRFLWLVGGASAVAGAVGLSHATLPWGPLTLSNLQHRQDAPLGVPVNRTAREAGATDAALDPAWRLTVTGPTSRQYSLAELDALPQATEVLPIACVEGWSVTATWRGVRLRDLLASADAEADAPVTLRSMQTRGAFRTTQMPANFAHDPRTLVALHLNGERLDVDHGYPARIIAPGRPGVLQTKWLREIEVL